MKFFSLIVVLFFSACNNSADTNSPAVKTDSITRDGTNVEQAKDTTADMLIRSKAIDNPAWQLRKQKGVAWLGIGTEPFWSIEKRQDSLAFQLSEWNQPIVMKAIRTMNTKDSVIYSGEHSSEKLEVRILPGTCSDGMSDRVYEHQVKVFYKQQFYSGCAVVF